MSWGGARLNTGINNTTDPATCKTVLAQSCVPSPPQWNRFVGYAIPGGGFKMTPQGFTDYTAEFLLTRGPYALLGYTWFGCTNGNTENPRAPEWDEDFGEPVNTCSETTPGSGVYTREWTKGESIARSEPARLAACEPSPETPLTQRPSRGIATSCTATSRARNGPRRAQPVGNKPARLNSFCAQAAWEGLCGAPAW